MTHLSLELFSQVNYWAVFTAGLVAFVLGGLWYSPALFENSWMAANGYSPQQVQSTLSGLVPFGFAGALVTYIVMALVFALLAAALGINNAVNCVMLGVVLWLGFVASSGFTVNLFSPRTLTAWMIDAGFQLVAVVVIATVIGVWR